MEKSISKSLLSKRKQEEINAAEEKSIAAGVQYQHAYDRFESFKALIDTPEKRAGIVFILGDCIEKVVLGFQMSPIIEQLGDPTTKEFLNYREFKLLQEIIKNIQISGRDNHIKLSQAMKSFNEAGVTLNTIEDESKMFAQEYQKMGQYYSKLCQKYGILPDDLENKIEAQYELEKHAAAVEADQVPEDEMSEEMSEEMPDEMSDEITDEVNTVTE